MKVKSEQQKKEPENQRPRVRKQVYKGLWKEQVAIYLLFLLCGYRKQRRLSDEQRKQARLRWRKSIQTKTIGKFKVDKNSPIYLLDYSALHIITVTFQSIIIVSLEDRC